MNISISERPGVYSGYGASSIVTAADARGAVGLVISTKGIPEPKRYTSGAAARADFPDSPSIYLSVDAALAGGASACWVSPVTASTASDGSISITVNDYVKAARALRDEDVYVLFCDSNDVSVWRALRDEAIAASNERRERICVFALPDRVDILVDCAELISCERCVLAGPIPIGADGEKLNRAAVAAAVGAAIVSLPDPAVPLGGSVLKGLYGAGGALDDADVDTLIKGGVTPLECVAGNVEIVRGVTTRVTTDGVADNTWRELSTILIADDVLGTLRGALKSRFARAKNLPSTRDAVANQTTIVLEQKKAAGIIADYGEVSATASDTDPSRCDVSFEFAVAYGMNRIVVAARILV